MFYANSTSSSVHHKGRAAQSLAGARAAILWPHELEHLWARNGSLPAKFGSGRGSASECLIERGPTCLHCVLVEGPFFQGRQGQAVPICLVKSYRSGQVRPHEAGVSAFWVCWDVHSCGSL